MKSYKNNNSIVVDAMANDICAQSSRRATARGALFIGCLLMLPQATLAQQTSSSVVKTTDAVVYPDNFFAQYQPRNALEMIERLPGFSFDEGDDGRGFGSNAGNVLIDGARPTAKSGGLKGVLTRIPAGQVLRIEVMRGGISAGEAEGQSIIANVIRSKNLTTGNWTLRTRQAGSSSVQPNFETTISTQMGLWETSFGADVGADPMHRSALIENRGADNRLSSGTRESSDSIKRFGYVNGEGARQVANGKLTLNGLFSSSVWKNDLSRDIFRDQLPDGGAPDLFRSFNEKQKVNEAELGIDWSGVEDHWKLHLIALGQVNDERYDYEFRDQNNSDGEPDSVFVQDGLKTEYVLRTTYGEVGSAQFKPEFGVEVANNRLDTGAIFIESNITTPVPGSDVVIQEWRGETFATFVYEASSALSVEGGVTVEFSQIKVTGAADKEQTFKFIKPRLSSTYKFDDDISLTFEAQRRVGQLDFSDFATSAQAEDDRTTSGNPQLAPDQTTELSMTFDWSFNERGSLKMTAFREWRSDILEQIELPADDQGFVGQGLGNAGKAQTWGLLTELNMPLDYVLPNGLIQINYRLRGSHFDDPIIQADRSISNYTPDYLRFEFRQDLTEQQWAWGISYKGSFRYNRYLVDEIQSNEANHRYNFFIETTRFFGVKTQFFIENANTTRLPRTRMFYDGTRAGAFVGSEIAKRKNRAAFLLSFFGTF
ncbi:MAG: hypothetical protein ACI8WB_002946 [Phenylobacterium sp.]|jgi:hypothetical protein